MRLNIGRRYWGARMSHLPDSVAGRIARKYVDEHETHLPDGWGLFIYGPNGTGKTYTAAAVLIALTELGYTGFCVLASTLKIAYIDGQRFDPNQTVVERARTVDVLIIEDLGAEYSGKGSDWAELCFEDLLRYRNRQCLATIVTTNLDRAGFVERYKRAAASLAMESMIAVSCSGDDRRAQEAKAKAHEFRGCT